MKNKALFISLVVGGIYASGLFTFCGKKINCPAYGNNAAFDKWFPYQQGQRIVFTNGASGRDSVRIRSVEMSGSYKTSNSGYGGCSTSATITSEETDSAGKWKLGLTDVGYNVDLSLKGLALQTQNLSEDSGMVGNNGSTALVRSYFTYYTLGGRIYPFVEVLEKTSGNINGRPYKVYISPQSGIVGYELFPTNELWTLQ